MSSAGYARHAFHAKVVCGFEILADPSISENGVPTPSLQTRRAASEKHYADVIDTVFYGPGSRKTAN